MHNVCVSYRLLFYTTRSKFGPKSIALFIRLCVIVLAVMHVCIYAQI